MKRGVQYDVEVVFDSLIEMRREAAQNHSDNGNDGVEGGPKLVGNGRKEHGPHLLLGLFDLLDLGDVGAYRK